MALWGLKYFPFWHMFAAGDTDALGIPVQTMPFLEMVAEGLLPNVSFVDPSFDVEDAGTSPVGRFTISPTSLCRFVLNDGSDSRSSVPSGNRHVIA
jgi:hypothetical protein